MFQLMPVNNLPFKEAICKKYGTIVINFAFSKKRIIFTC
jgi:hypothetical protein